MADGRAAGAGEQPGARVAVSRPRVALGAALVLLGVVLWVATGKTWFGLVSGLGALVVLQAAEPWLEERRRRDPKA